MIQKTNPELLLKVSIQVGRMLLESGAETTRVEQTVTHVMNAYHVEDASTFATPTGLFIAFDYLGVSYAKSARVTKNKIDLEKINHINHLSRQIKPTTMSLSTLNEELQRIKQLEGYPFVLKCFGGTGVAMFFTLLAVPSIPEGFFAGCIGLIITWLNDLLEKKAINFFIKVITLSSIVALIALLLERGGLIVHRDQVIIGSLMILVPGVAITNAIRDTIAGDLLSGITRGVEAVLIAVGLAIGAGFIIIIWSNLFGGV